MEGVDGCSCGSAAADHEGAFSFYCVVAARDDCGASVGQDESHTGVICVVADEIGVPGMSG